MSAKEATPDPKRVFVVHGRNQQARDSTFAFLRAIGLEPIEWNEAIALTGHASPYIGQVLDAAFGAARAVVVLLTPDEITYLRSEYAQSDDDPETTPAAQARPNVLFEAGMAMGRDQTRTVLVELGKLRQFSDVFGRHVVKLDNSEQHRRDLAERLRVAGCTVNLEGEDWKNAGEFTPPPEPGGGLPLGRKVPQTSARRRYAIDLRFHPGHNSGQLEIINRGTEDIFEVDLGEFPDGSGVWLERSELPLEKIPSGRSAHLVAARLGGMGVAPKSNFELKVTFKTEEGEERSEDAYLSVRG